MMIKYIIMLFLPLTASIWWGPLGQGCNACGTAPLAPPTSACGPKVRARPRCTMAGLVPLLSCVVRRAGAACVCYKDQQMASRETDQTVEEWIKHSSSGWQPGGYLIFVVIYSHSSLSG